MTDAPVFWTDILRDGTPCRLLRCPVCGVWGEIDDDQFEGLVSVEHSGESGCAFHEKVDVHRDGEYVTPAQYHDLGGFNRRGGSDGT